jgi:hypothetical protein
LDLYGAYEFQNGGAGSLRLYNPLGETSAIQIQVLIQPGLHAFLSEPFVPYPNSPGSDPLQEYYVEDDGVWKVGKQFLPFGNKNIIRENVLAAAGQTNLLFENMNLVAAICDGGAGNQQGVVGRFGGIFGVSGALGRHFGISPTSLDVVRPPEDSPGTGHGWQQIYGLDDSRRTGMFTTAAEGVLLMGGETTSDRNGAIFDLSEQFSPSRNRDVTVGYSYSTPQNDNIFRVTGHVPVTKTTTLEPLVRYRNGKLWDSAISVHVRL